jgi:hypothetical protein
VHGAICRRGKGWLLVMTKGHVFYQEPVRVAFQLFYSPDLKVSRLLDREGRERGGARGARGRGWGGGVGGGGGAQSRFKRHLFFTCFK